MIEPLTSAIPAATLVILRESVSGPPDILMVERAPAMSFAAGALVFPGGRVDPGDGELADEAGGDREETAARIAAIRETVEEVGLAIGLSPLPSAAEIIAWRSALARGHPFASLLADGRTTVALEALTPFARWRPAHRPLRVYDTRFYLARLPAGAGIASVDATENTRLFWASAIETLALVDAGQASVIFPTRRNLERLARFATIDEAFADAARYPVETVTPWIEQRGGIDHLCIPEGIGYPIAAEPLASTRRG